MSHICFLSKGGDSDGLLKVLPVLALITGVRNFSKRSIFELI